MTSWTARKHGMKPTGMQIVQKSFATVPMDCSYLNWKNIAKQSAGMVGGLVLAMMYVRGGRSAREVAEWT